MKYNIERKWNREAAAKEGRGRKSLDHLASFWIVLGMILFPGGEGRLSCAIV